MSRDALISQGLGAEPQPPTKGSAAGCAGVRSQRPRPVYRVEVEPTPADPKAVASLVEWLRDHYELVADLDLAGFCSLMWRRYLDPRLLKGQARLEYVKSLHDGCQGCRYTPAEADRSRALHVHHVIPRAQGGEDDTRNLLVLCARCHALAHAFMASRPRAKHTRERILHRLWYLKKRSTP